MYQLSDNHNIGLPNLGWDRTYYIISYKKNIYRIIIALRMLRICYSYYYNVHINHYVTMYFHNLYIALLATNNNSITRCKFKFKNNSFFAVPILNSLVKFVGCDLSRTQTLQRLYIWPCDCSYTNSLLPTSQKDLHFVCSAVLGQVSIECDIEKCSLKSNVLEERVCL